MDGFLSWTGSGQPRIIRAFQTPSTRHRRQRAAVSRGLARELTLSATEGPAGDARAMGHCSGRRALCNAWYEGDGPGERVFLAVSAETMELRCPWPDSNRQPAV